VGTSRPPLKTLTVLSPGGTAQVSGVELDLRVTRTRRLALAGLDDAGGAPSFLQQLERLESALGVVRVASAEESEILSRRIVDSEERRARLSRELAAVDPYPPLARTKAILLGLNAGVPKG
jgi:hypothetical protein